MIEINVEIDVYVEVLLAIIISNGIAHAYGISDSTYLCTMYIYKMLELGCIKPNACSNTFQFHNNNALKLLNQLYFLVHRVLAISPINGGHFRCFCFLSLLYAFYNM